MVPQKLSLLTSIQSADHFQVRLGASWSAAASATRRRFVFRTTFGFFPVRGPSQVHPYAPALHAPLPPLATRHSSLFPHTDFIPILATLQRPDAPRSLTPHAPRPCSMLLCVPCDLCVRHLTLPAGFGIRACGFVSDFGLLSSFGLRHSSFSVECCQPPLQLPLSNATYYPSVTYTISWRLGTSTCRKSFHSLAASQADISLEKKKRKFVSY